jgi:hypothetical protein
MAAASDHVGAALVGVFVANYDFNSCMEELGWRSSKEVRRSELKQLREMEHALAEGAKQARSALSADPFCAGLGAMTPANTVMRAMSQAERFDVRPGDRIVGIEGTPIPTHGELKTELLKRRPGEVIDVTVLRGAEEIHLKVECQDGRPLMGELIAALDAAGRGDWAGCLPHVDAMEQLAIVSSATAELRLACYMGDLQSRGQRGAADLPRLVYQTTRLALEEARYDPSGTAVDRGTALVRLDWLESQGYKALAEDLRVLATIP